ncbi:MAG: hypothetical protein RL148_2583 [Planctomycetota bacterium]
MTLVAAGSLVRHGIVASLLLVAACSNGSSSSEPAPEPLPPSLDGALYLGGGTLKANRDFTVRAVDQGGIERARAESTGNSHFQLHHDGWGTFVGRVEAAVEVQSAWGLQTVHLRQDLDLVPPAADGLSSSGPVPRPYCWLGPVSTVASRYRILNPSVSIAAAERLAAEHLGVVPASATSAEGTAPGDLHTSFGDSHRSPFSWSQFVADAGTMPIDAALDVVVAELGTATPPRNHRKPHPYPALASLVRDGVGGGVGKGGGYPWSESGGKKWLAKGIGEDAHFLGTSTLAGTVLAQAGWGQRQDPTAGYLAALEQLDDDVRALQATAIASSYEIAWRNTVQSVNPACTRTLAVHNQFATYVTPGVSAPQQAALALRDYSRQSAGGMTQDFTTIRDALVGRATPNGPLASIFAAHLMLDRCGISTPRADLLYLEMRTNAWLEQLQQVQDYYLGCLFLSMNLQMEYANLDPYTFPMVGGTGNSMAARINLLSLLAYGDSLATPPTPGFFADVVAAGQLAPPPTIGHDDILIDCVAANGARPTLWSQQLLPGSSSMANNLNTVGGFALGPWPAGSFRLPSAAEVAELRIRAIASAGNVLDGLRKLGFQNVPNPSANQAAYVIAVDVPYNTDRYWLVDLVSGDYASNSYGEILYTPNNNGLPACQVLLCRSAPSPEEDPGTAIHCATPLALLGEGPDSFAASYPALDMWNQNTLPDQAVSTVVPATDPTAGFLMRSRIVWQFDPPTAPIRVLNGLDDVANPPVPPALPTPFVQYLAPVVTPVPDPSTVTLVGQLYTGYQGAPGSVGNLRAAPMTLRVPLTTLQLQPGMPPNSPAVLSSVLAIPRGIVFTNPSATPYVDCYATGYFKDSTVWPAQAFDLTRPTTIASAPVSVTWSVTSPSGLARFSTGTPNRLLLSPAQGVETMTITVTATHAGVTVSDTATCYTNF